MNSIFDQQLIFVPRQNNAYRRMVTITQRDPILPPNKRKSLSQFEQETLEVI
jgi:hypothetical protein